MYNKTHIVFRPPFINGRPQDSNSIFWALVLVFSFSPSFLKRGYQGSLRGDRGRPGETGGDRGGPGETGGDRGRPGETGGDRGRPGETRGDQGSTGPLLGHIFGDMGL